MPIHPGDFSAQAQSYAAARPGYPPVLVGRLCQRAGVIPGDPVADIGAGTGIFTALLAERGLRVTAVEPNAEMRAEASAMANVAWLEGTFEELNLPDQSQAWVTAAQAFHWADPVRALPRIRRLLRPGGRLTVLWNNRRTDREPTVAWAHAAINRHVPGFAEAYVASDWREVLVSTGDFTSVAYDQALHVTTMSVERFVALWRSHNRLNAAAGPARFEAFIVELRDHLHRHQVTTVRVPYTVKCWTAVRV